MKTNKPKSDLEKEFFSNFEITEEPQEYKAYPCRITNFQQECIGERLREALQQARQEGIEEAIKVVEEKLSLLKHLSITEAVALRQVLSELKKKGIK